MHNSTSIEPYKCNKTEFSETKLFYDSRMYIRNSEHNSIEDQIKTIFHLYVSGKHKSPNKHYGFGRGNAIST